jgi:outer membrane protein
VIVTYICPPVQGYFCIKPHGMKNGLLIWNVVLSLVAGYLLIAHFGSKKGSDKRTGNTLSDTVAAQGKFRMAYFEMDSVASSFEMVKELKAEMAKKEDEINSEMDRLGKNLQQRYNFFQKKAQDGTLTQTESDAASQEMKTLDEQMKNRRLQLDQEYNDFTVRRQNDIKLKIEDFFKKYNQEKKYSYIVSYEQGLFYFKDTAYNITADVVKGLNEMYKTKSK